MDEFHRYKKESLLWNGLITLAFGLLPTIAYLVTQAVDLSGISISASGYIVASVISLFIGGIGNAARLNSKYKKRQNL
ncbi:MAG: hypothetical protein CL907_04450 [Dehalococcoidia bacterium]|nr:hypothetical protein [Dehalococcoidia bacterium]MEC7921121.1 hypothetical protein [Chloroflexota bacterium]MEC9451719.1 hypothetical protein [Chloroflexota bacterium]MQG04275.1 hypothetical protein [SAR202 cluster bacterium]|tara:strand:+ start:288 stop:521 length:234 start_codon:yes stop_codon:yes gene_type:complete